MSDWDAVSRPSISDAGLDAILQAADTDLAAALEQATDTLSMFQVVIAANAPRPRPSISDARLDAILQAADTDLAAALEQETDTAAGARATVKDAMRAHPAHRGLANEA